MKRKRSLERLKKAKKRKKLIKIYGIVIIVFCSLLYVGNIKKTRISKQNIYDSKEVIAVQEVPKNKDENYNKKITIDSETILKETTESEKVKEIIDEYRKNKNLNEDNFAFFYYRPDNGEYYFFNEEKLFTAASTIKVPLAMIYYDKINNNDLRLDDTFKYKSSQYEAGAGSTAVNYKPGNEIELSFLLEQMIVESDNTATNILRDNLGGEKAYRILIKQYTSRDFPEEFNENNLTSAGFGLDIMKRLYINQDKYSQLLELMKKSSGGGYLKRDVNCQVAHKYGSFEGYVHDYGICYTEVPYLIGIFTKDVDNAEDLIANINKQIVDLK